MTSTGSPSRGTDELKARHTRIRWTGLLVSLLLHLLLFFVLSRDRAPLSPFAAAGPRAGDDRAAAAGGGMQVVSMRPVEERPPVVRPPEPVPAPDVTVEPEELPEPEVEPMDFAALPGTGGRDQGPLPGTGIDGGTGAGDGGTEAEGRFRVVPPTPRGLILPPSDRPKSVRGKEVTVWVFVTETGRVVADSTRLLPPTGDGKFDERLRRQAAEWVFQPARRDGKAVAEWFRYLITL